MQGHICGHVVRSLGDVDHQVVNPQYNDVLGHRKVGGSDSRWEDQSRERERRTDLLVLEMLNLIPGERERAALVAVQRDHHLGGGEGGVTRYTHRILVPL